MLPLQKEIREFLRSEETEFRFEMTPLDVIDCMLGDEGFDTEEDLEQSGWEMYLTKVYPSKEGTVKIEFNGSLYYGRYRLNKL